MIFDCDPSPFRGGVRYVCGDGTRLGEISLERHGYTFHFHAWADKLSKDDHDALRKFAKEQVLILNITRRLLK